MSYSGLINTNINRAFNMVKDLAIEVSLSKKSSASFDFGTDAVTTTATTVLTKAVITDVTKTSKDNTVIKKIAMLSTKNIGEISGYDVLSFENTTWRIGPIINSTQFITIAEIYKET